MQPQGSRGPRRRAATRTQRQPDRGPTARQPVDGAPASKADALIHGWTGRALAVRPGQRADLLQHTRDVGHRPVFDDLAVADAVDRDAFGLDLPVRRGDAEEFSCVHTAADDVADDEISLRDLQPDLMTPGSSDPKDLCRLLHSLTVQADARDRRIVGDEVV